MNPIVGTQPFGTSSDRVTSIDIGVQVSECLTFRLVMDCMLGPFRRPLLGDKNTNCSRLIKRRCVAGSTPAYLKMTGSSLLLEIGYRN
jgi:hypothetical protein